MLLLDITTFLGRLHPLVVHLPIGFLLLALVFELLSYHKSFAYLKQAVAFTILLGFIAAGSACILGYILSLSGDYEYQLLNNHKVAGIIVAVGAGILYLLTTERIKSRFFISRKLFSGLFIGLFVLTTYAGHQGGNLTHGSDYLSMRVIQEQERKKPASLGEALLFEDVVQPLLASKCGQCHRGGKLKGQLSVETLADLLKGGKSRAAVVGGKLQESELYSRITLDPSNKKFMPADGKTPLTKDEAAIISWWIEKGMAGVGIKVADLKSAETIQPKIAAYLGFGDGDANNTDAGIVVNPDIPGNFNPNLLDSLHTPGLQVRIMSHKPMMLDVTVKASSPEQFRQLAASLKPVAKHIIWLNVSNNQLTENDLDLLPLMANLEKLRLEKNPVSDGISNQLSGLQHLQAVNLNETKITSGGLQKLQQLPNLKRVYTWKTLAE